MVVPPHRQHLILPVAPFAAAVVGTLTAIFFALMPTGILESIVLDSGLAAIMPAAEPPLGLTARAVLICAGGGGIGLIAWFGLLLAFGMRAIVVQRAGKSREDEAAPVLRRADAHPDAPPRRPVFANRDLGTPFLEVRARPPIHVNAEVPPGSLSTLIRGTHVESAPPIGVASDDEREIPADLDVPLAAYDPEAIPQKPLDWTPRPESPVATRRQQVFDPGERFETFELTPPVRPAAAPAAATPSDSGFACAPEPEPEAKPGNKPWPVPSPSATPGSGSAPLPIAAEAPVPVPTPVSASVPPPAPRPERRAPIERPDPSATIHALLDRLERSVARHENPPPPPPPPAPVPREESLQEALVTLRRLASRG